MSEATKKKLVIVGGVAGGATAAARARRLDENAEITLIEGSGYISFANCGLPYHIGGDIPKRETLLLRTPQDLWNRYRIRALVNTRVTNVDRAKKIVTYVQDGQTHELPYDKLILSQGGDPMKPAVEGIENIPHFSLRWVEDMDAIIEQMAKTKHRHVAVVGGGFIGIEVAEALRHKHFDVTLVEFAPGVMPNLDPEFSNLAKKELEAHGIRVLTQTTIKKAEKDGGTGGAGPRAATDGIHASGGALTLSDGSTFNADFIVFAAGVKPETSLAKQIGLEIGKTGGVVVNDFMQSSDEDIYVVGDMAEITNRITHTATRVPLAGPANRQGRLAAENALMGNRCRYRGALGSSVIKIFGKTLASTGLTEKAAKAANISAQAVMVHSNNHAGYYPNSERIALKLVFSPADGRVLGAQAFGPNGTEKRIDVIATAIVGWLTIYDLAGLDLTYAPPYSSANDPVNMAAFQAMNHHSGLSPVITPAEFAARRGEFALLDVRGAGEIRHYPVESEYQIPVDHLRENLSQIPKDKPLAVLCQSGQRSYIAQRILKQSGYKEVFNITGGWLGLAAQRGKWDK
jgi:NADPH-dependent 2,4-dienoyl-CoA reductase/sulfur reductase-like enzyme/rhodanese-related sulfurtransferase